KPHGRRRCLFEECYEFARAGQFSGIPFRGVFLLPSAGAAGTMHRTNQRLESPGSAHENSPLLRPAPPGEPKGSSLAQGTEETAMRLASLRAAAGFGLGLCVWALAGCGDGSGLKVVPVAGKLTIDGQPLTTGSISFRPDAARGNRSQHHPTGTIDEEGRYQLFTAGKKGAPLGWYKVMVFAQESNA